MESIAPFWDLALPWSPIPGKRNQQRGTWGGGGEETINKTKPGKGVKFLNIWHQKKEGAKNPVIFVNLTLTLLGLCSRSLSF